MPTPRAQLISLKDTPWYHCISRCVRRAWLCGNDQDSGKNYEHRKEWIVDRLKLLSSAFAIEVAAYCVMSNHHHEVLRVDEAQADAWDFEEVIKRWHKVYKGNFLSQRYIAGDHLSSAESKRLAAEVQIWRQRLSDISWFMRALNEPIARRANAEDKCTGKFFEARFKSQALLDEKAVLACMAYVDLNPVRAKLVERPEDSQFASIVERIAQANKECIQTSTRSFLAEFNGDKGSSRTSGVPYSLLDYLDLVDWTGRSLRSDKRGCIHSTLPPILDRLELTSDEWLSFSNSLEVHFGNWVGGATRLKQASKSVDQCWICHSSGSSRFYVS